MSPGCNNCYAFQLHDQRYAKNTTTGKMFAGLLEPEGSERQLRHDEGWPQNIARVGAPPEGWAARARALGGRMPLPAQYDRPFSQVQLLEARLTEPLHWRRPRAVFVDSMADLFHEDVPDEYLDRVFAVMALSPQHIFQVLTKRPERMRAYLTQEGYPRHDVEQGVEGAMEEIAAAQEWCAPPLDRWPLPNVWLGVSAEDQERFDERWPLLSATPAAVKFVSYEPALGPLAVSRPPLPPVEITRGVLIDSHPDWIIVGGESGPQARPFDVGWARSILEQCRAAGVAVFVKQLGSKPIMLHPKLRSDDIDFDAQHSARLKHSHGGDMGEWPEDLRVREFPAGLGTWEAS